MTMDETYLPSWTGNGTDPTPEQRDAFREWNARWTSGEPVPMGKEHTGYLHAMYRELTGRMVGGEDSESAGEALCRLWSEWRMMGSFLFRPLEVGGQYRLGFEWLKEVFRYERHRWPYGNPFRLKVLSGDWSLDPEGVFALVNGPKWGLSSGFGTRNLPEILPFLAGVIEDHVREKGCSFVEILWTEVKPTGLTEEDFRRLFPTSDQLELRDLYDGYEQELADARLLDGDQEIWRPVLLMPPEMGRPVLERPFVPSVLEEASSRRAKALVKEAENRYRDEIGRPHRGKQHKNETQLFEQLQAALPGETVLHHARPPWLGRQHLDIYFPHHMIAVEYDGIHHRDAPDHWGGEEATAYIEEKDAEKERKCQRAGCGLIRVQPDFDLDDLVREIKNRIDAA